MWKIRWVDIRVFLFATILIAHSPLVFKKEPLLGSKSEPLGSRLETFLILPLFLLLFSVGPNGGYMSMRAANMEGLKNALGCIFDEVIGISRSTATDKIHRFKGEEGVWKLGY